MIKIDIMEGASYNNLDALKKVWHHSWKLQKVEINWNLRYDTVDAKNSETWPFKALFSEGQDEIVVRIYSLTAGYGGSGPHDLMSILNWLGVKYYEKDILTERMLEEDGWIHLVYVV